MNIFQVLHSGLAVPEIASYALHTSMGVFFACSGYNKITSPTRHRTFVETLAKDKVPFLHFNEWWVPGWEFVGGVSLALGFAPAFSAAVLLIICLVACAAEGKSRVEAYKPINAEDRVADWLYLPEVLYSLILGSIVLGV